MAYISAVGDRTPVISPTAWVAPTATIVGGVTLGERASVFYGAVLRADVDTITIGDDTNLQDNVTMHCDAGVPAVLGARISVGHGAILHGCTVEDDCLIGMGATVLNGAVIGSGSLVAAGAVVLEGTIVPPGSLVAGVPAKVRRELSADEQDGIRRNAQHYLTISAMHAALGDGQAAG
jgi:carbonic anhydrase/acetyltransferase-like protein (isoleucine patch superfamily)